jgi:hypothetical protein
MANYTGASTATEYNTSYLPRALDRREPFKPRSELQQREGRVDDRTTHRLIALIVIIRVRAHNYSV